MLNLLKLKNNYYQESDELPRGVDRNIIVRHTVHVNQV